MKNAALLAHVRQLCCLRLGGRAIMPALLKAVRELVAYDLAEFLWVDAEGEVTNLYAEPMPPEPVLEYYFRHAGEPGAAAFCTSFRARAAQPEPVSVLAATEAVRRTEFHRAVLGPLSAEHALFVVIRRHGRPLGQLALYRRDPKSPFAAAERTAIAAIAGYFAHGLDDAFPDAGATGADAGYRDTEHEAMVILSRDGALRHCSSAARRLLLYVALDSINRGTVSQQHAAITGVMRELAEQLRVRQPGHAAGANGPPGLIVNNRWGRFVLRAHWLTDEPLAPDALIGAQVRRQEPTVLRLSQAMQGLSLSPQQKEVGLLVAQGRSNPEIAGVLGVSLNTANYHVKQLFVKLNAHERSEIASKLLGIGESGSRAAARQAGTARSARPGL